MTAVFIIQVAIFAATLVNIFILLRTTALIGALLNELAEHFDD